MITLHVEIWLRCTSKTRDFQETPVMTIDFDLRYQSDSVTLKTVLLFMDHVADFLFSLLLDKFYS